MPLKSIFYVQLDLQLEPFIQRRTMMVRYDLSCCSYLIISTAIMLAPLSCGIGCGIFIAYLICKQEALLIDIPLGFRVNSIISLQCVNEHHDKRFLHSHSLLASIGICIVGLFITTISAVRKVTSTPIAKSLKSE